MDLNDVRSIMTVVAFATFVGIVVWAYSGRRQQAFSEAARLPFEEEEREAAEPRAAEGRAS